MGSKSVASRRTALVALATLAVATVGGQAWAAQTTATLNVTATVIDNVRIVSLPELAFGNYDPTEGANVDATTTLTVKATKDLTYNAYFGSDRVLSDGTNSLNYELYSDAGRTSAWGSTLATAQSYTSTSGTTNALHTVYGRVAANQDVPPNAYTDTVTLTIEW